MLGHLGVLQPCPVLSTPCLPLLTCRTSVHHSEVHSLYILHLKEQLKVTDQTLASFTFFFLLYKITVKKKKKCNDS